MDRLGPYELGPGGENEGIYTGDARILSKAIPDESIDLIFTDPVYQNIDDYRWLAETAARVLVPGGNLVAFTGNLQSLEAIGIFLAREFEWCDWLVFRETARRRKRWDKNIIGLYELACWVNKSGALRIGSFVKNFTFVSNGYVKVDNFHDWQKEIGGVLPWVKSLSTSMVFDPFTGGGTVPAVCKMLNRRCLAFEIDPATADLARDRVRKTQPPLPGLTLETQAMLELKGDT